MKKCKIVILLFLITCLVFSTTGFLHRQMINALGAFAETKGNASLSLALQNDLYQYLREKEDMYLTIHYDLSERITAISIHSDKVTLLASEMSIRLLSTLDSYESSAFGIPIGNLTGSVLLSGKGPSISVRPIAIGNIGYEMQSSLQSAGINQTLHKVSIHFVLSVRYLTPIDAYSDTLSFDIVLAETLVVGDVPIYRD